MSDALAKRKTAMLELLDKSQDSIAAALPNHITPERMIRVARTALQTNPELMNCTPNSVIASIVEASSVGLEPNGVLGEGYLIPFKNTKAGTTDCQFMPSYRGFVNLARRSGEVKNISAHVVYDCDDFDYVQGVLPNLVHIPSLERSKSSKPIAVYAICFFKDGTYQFDVMGIQEIEERRQCSKSANGPAWNKWWGEMAKKTVIRRLCKMLPLTPQLQRAVMIDEYAEAGFESPPRSKKDYIDVDAVRVDSLRERLEAHVRADDEEPEEPEGKHQNVVDAGEPPWEDDAPYEDAPFGDMEDDPSDKIIVAKIKRVYEKPGGTDDKPWVRYKILTMDGDSMVTFSKRLGPMAHRIKESDTEAKFFCKIEEYNGEEQLKLVEIEDVE